MPLFRNDSPGALTMGQAIARHTARLEQERRRLAQKEKDKAAAARARMAKQLAAEGRGEDTEIAHLALGELVLPRVLQKPEVMAAIKRAAEAEGIPLAMLSVGNRMNSINPNTGAAEFGGLGREPFLLSDPYQTRLPSWREARGEELFDPRYRPQPTAPSIVQGPLRPPAPNIIDDPNMMPSFKGQAIASLPTDRNAQTRAMARDLFPHNTFNEVADRFGEYNGRRYYTDFDGAKYYADPALKAPTSMDNLHQNAKYAASLAGPAISETPATIGRRAGPVGALLGAAGSLLRSGLAQTLTGEQKPYEQLLREAGTNAVDEAVGNPVEGFLKRNKLWPRF